MYNFKQPAAHALPRRVTLLSLTTAATESTPPSACTYTVDAWTNRNHIVGMDQHLHILQRVCMSGDDSNKHTRAAAERISQQDCKQL